MPAGAPFHSFIRPYPIRVDAFATPANALDYQVPALHLLTHTHTDHLVGLSSNSFGAVVVCSPVAKEMLLNFEPTHERVAYDKGLRRDRFRPYANLRIDPIKTKDGKTDYTYARDLLRPIPLNTPTEVELSASLTVTITALDANHCPGAVMYLVEGPEGAVLHTGDVRAEPVMLEQLARNPLIQKYIPSPFSRYMEPIEEDSPLKTLEAIHIDTARLIQATDVLSKEEASSGLVELMRLFSDTTKFFINAWTWGYEDALKAVARNFSSKIHIDRYKHNIFNRICDPFLASIATEDTRTRFHACDRWNRCSEIENGKEDVVSIDPVDMGRATWEIYFAEVKNMLMRGERVTNLLMPLVRHSPLPELKSLVALFRPKRVIPNELLPPLFGLDYACFPAMFGPYLQPGGAELIQKDIRRARVLKPDIWDNIILDVKDVQAENVTGIGAEELVRLWRQPQPDDVLKNPDMDEFQGNEDLLSLLLTYLPPELANQLRANLPQIKARYARMIREVPMQVEVWGEDSSQTVDGESQDDSWLAAHFLPEAAHQPIIGSPGPTSGDSDVSRTMLASEGTLAADSAVIVLVTDGEFSASAAIPPPHNVLGESPPISDPQFESSAPSGQFAVEENQGYVPSASLSKKRLRDPGPPDVPIKRRRIAPVREGEPSVASTPALKSSSSISQKQPKESHKPSLNPISISAPSVYVSSKFESKARHLGFKDEAEIQNLAAMREKLRVMTSKPVEGDKPDHMPDKPEMGSSSHSKNIHHSPRTAEDSLDRSLEKVIRGIKGRRSTARLRCVGSQSQGP